MQEDIKEHGPFSRLEVVEIINSVMHLMQKGDSPSQAYEELQNLVNYIKEAKMEISSISTNDINDKHIPDATEELDAVVDATEEATGAIMDACDAISEITTSLEQKNKANIQNEITKIYEACSFQDITGQRISKVVKALKDIEEKVNHIVDTLSRDLNIETQNNEEDTNIDKKTGDEALLNGPQMPGKGVSQSEIDALLASFD